MGWFPEMETEAWREYAQRRVEEEAQRYAEYLQEKATREFDEYVAMREEEMKKTATRQR